MSGQRKIREGVVVSNKMTKTVVVSIERRAMNQEFKKIVKQVSKVKAHDEKNECQIGDRVQLVETRPLSKDKSWRVQKILVKGELERTEEGPLPQ